MKSFLRLWLVLGLPAFVVAGFLLPVAAAPSLAGAPAAKAVTAPAELLQFTSAGHMLGFQPDAMLVATGSHALRVQFVDANLVTPQSDATSDSAAPAYAVPPLTSVSYPNLWDGVTLTYDAHGIVRSTYRLEPYADPSAIHLRYNRPALVQPDGSLRLAFETETMQESVPIAWQEHDGQRVPVDVTFKQLNDTDIGFAPGAYDLARPLFIDPTVTWQWENP
jgi:hypothetical protein